MLCRSSSRTTRREMTMFLLRLLTLRMRNRSFLPSMSSRFGILLSATCEPGRNASTPNRSTLRPPLIRRFGTPSTIDWSSCASLILSQTCRKSALRFETRTSPSWSSVASSSTLISSPGLISSGSVNSSMGIRPSDLKPMSTITSFSLTERTRPLTSSPSSIERRVDSYISAIASYSSRV